MASSAVALDDVARKTGTPVARDMASAPVITAAKKIAAGTTPSGLSRASMAMTMPRIAVAGREVAHHLVMHAADLADAGEPGQRAGEQRRRDQDAPDVDAAIARRFRRSRP